MAYNKAFNPDALPAHAEPEEAAQALSHLQRHRNDSPPTKPPLPATGHRSSSPDPRRNPPAGHAGHAGLPSQQASYRPNNAQAYPRRSSNNQSYGEQFNRLQSPQLGGGYGFGARPPAEPAAGRRLSSESHQYPSRTPAPPDPDSVDLLRLFRAANASGTGSLTTTELGSALVNADFTPFDTNTISSLMRMFTNSPPNQPYGPTITFSEFENLWRFLAAWRTLFERFDEDSSGRISLPEFTKALVAFGYRLSPPFVGVLYSAFNDRGPAQARGMGFDLFVQACISLRRMTDVFKKYDDDRDGYITLSFEEFLSESLRLRD